jgi:NADPH:quinone reductase
MRAILVDEKKELAWREVPDPVVNKNEVLVEVHAAGVNRADLLQRAGKYPSPPGWPDRMGLEVSGVILNAPAQSRWKRGDKVCALLGGGGYSELCAVPQEMVLPVPEGLSMAEAAAVPEVFATAWLNICMEGGMKSGDTVFIQAGGSGLGTAAIQMVKTLGGKVMTTVGSEEKKDFVRGLGADIVINRKREDAETFFEKHPVDIAMDCAAGKALGPCVEKMAPGGRWIVIATLGGDISEINMGIFFRKGLRLIGSTLRSRSSEMKGKILAGMEAHLWPKFSSGEIKPVIYKTLPLSQAGRAHEILQRNENIGKVVLAVR